MSTYGVLVVAVALIALVLYWSSKYGTRGRSAGTSLRRGPSAHTTSTGRSKMSFATREEATARAQLLAKRDGTLMSAYHCGTCNKWHLGH